MQLDSCRFEEIANLNEYTLVKKFIGAFHSTLKFKNKVQILILLYFKGILAFIFSKSIYNGT